MKYFQVAQGVWGMKLFYVNVYMIANRRDFAKGWVLVDAGPAGSGDKIIKMAENLFGKGTQPNAIILTHGHADHSGSVPELLKHWDVPVYAHEFEIPYLTGQSAYPPADPSVGHGLMSLLSVFFSRSPVDLSGHIKPVNMAGGLDELPEWRVVFTPGHSPGHISLFFPLNTTLIAGDAVATTHAESAIGLLGDVKKLSGPPMYMTPDWASAEQSVGILAQLEPRIIAAGHGPVLRGREATEALKQLSANFNAIAVPSSGRYVDKPAVADETGTKYIPPFTVSTKFKAATILLGMLAGFMITKQIRA
ncbi:MBL fold metallo-hydrolase [Mucilaginibacter mali]|uniref:MBL fold metallo-hydrolase n=1 Tax=Mucilaginibacter mali TaxID=2740462 RepID=A0A7D4PTH1_9SPHI|nr:MBL fold metallo-hydrolase [Mucilaginibacter mali]QKJ29988.1 MBL fold metallo-hydrolase [Mucilaginibacter mali]